MDGEKDGGHHRSWSRRHCSYEKGETGPGPRVHVSLGQVRPGQHHHPAPQGKWIEALVGESEDALLPITVQLPVQGEELREGQDARRPAVRQVRLDG